MCYFGLVIKARAVCELLRLKSSVFLKCTIGVFEFKVKVFKCGREEIRRWTTTRDYIMADRANWKEKKVRCCVRVST